MMKEPNTVTAPDKEFSASATCGLSAGTSLPATLATGSPPFEQIKHLLSENPLRRPQRHQSVNSQEDRIDTEALRERAGEPSQPWDDVKNELGL